MKLIKKPLTTSIVKLREEDFLHTKYKGTSVDQMSKVVKINHPSTRVGRLVFGKHVSIRKSISLDMVGDISMGDFVIFSDNVSVLTHDHNVKSRDIILSQDESKGVQWSNLEIGDDVYFGYNSVITKNVTKIPNGFILAASAVLTKNPEPYEIWGGVPAKKIGIRE
jgi:acetyltransferase-like isoleucine patch superfamily enzyme